jgi:hypothetical protein
MNVDQSNADRPIAGNFYLLQQPKQKIIYWIDDEPLNNTFIINKYFKIHNIKTEQIPSTSAMKLILKNQA